MAEWYDNALVLRDFADALEDVGIVEDSKEVFRKPYRFNEEYAAWVSVGSPSQEDAEWDNFVNALEGESEDATSSD
jgi:hypothetical protein